MTKDEALKLALPVMERMANEMTVGQRYSNEGQQLLDALLASREALAEQPAQQEPVEYWTVADGWVSEQAEVPSAVWVESDFWEHCNRVNCGTAYRLPAPGRQPLYTHPPASKPLTDAEIGIVSADIWGSVLIAPQSYQAFARAIEAKLKEKNT